VARATIVFGVGLILVGVFTYLATGGASVTALIPAFVGVPMLLAGVVALRAGWRLYGLYAACALALLMGLGTLRGVIGLLGGQVSTATVINAVLLVASVVFLVFCFREIRGGRHPETRVR
jgi:hypothetical protein